MNLGPTSKNAKHSGKIAGRTVDINVLMAFTSFFCHDQKVFEVLELEEMEFFQLQVDESDLSVSLEYQDQLPFSVYCQ